MNTPSQPNRVCEPYTPFVVAGSLAHEWVARRMTGGSKMAAVGRAVEAEAFKVVLLTLLSPVLPFNLLNYAFDLTAVPLQDLCARLLDRDAAGNHHVRVTGLRRQEPRRAVAGRDAAIGGTAGSVCARLAAPWPS